MNTSGHSANLHIEAAPGAVPQRSVSACRQDAAFEIRLQDVRWSSPGQTTVTAGARCALELLLPGLAGGVEGGEAEYIVVGEHGRRRAVGRLNFVAPFSALELQWSPGKVRSLVCMFDPARLGLLGGLAWDWADVDPMAALELNNDRLETAMHWLCDELLQPSFASELQVSSMLTMLALETRRHFGARTTSPDAVAGKLNTRQLAAVKSLIEQSPPEGLPLHEMGLALDMSGRELATMFKNTVGVTLRSYVATSHIAKAKLLLADPRLLIKQVAWRSGFESAAAFTAAFRKSTGLTPLQYREQCRGQRSGARGAA